MLDQNTDRMWFVIGALVVGAGIILLANKAMPEIFASIAETFRNSSDDAIEVVDRIKPNVPHIIPTVPIQQGPHSEIENLVHSDEGTSFILTHYPTSNTKSGAYFIIMDMDVKMDSKYMVSYNIQKLSGKPMRVHGYINNNIKNTFTLDGKHWGNSYYPIGDRLIHDDDIHHITVGFDMSDPGMTDWTQYAIQPARYQEIVQSGSTEPIVVKVTNMVFKEIID